MKSFGPILSRAAMLLLVFTVVCGAGYTALVTALAQVLFPAQANGSIIEVNGVKYASELMAQPYQDPGHLWGRVMKLDVTTFQDQNGESLLYAAPSNLSPASEDYAALIAERVALLKAANPAMADAPVPVDLVTGSGSGLDPHISPAAAAYQVPRLAAAHQISEQEVQSIIDACTEERFLGVFGERVVNVQKVNLMLDGIL